MSSLIGACSSCGKMVAGQVRFIGDPTYHCKEPPCWPLSLWLMEKNNWASKYIDLKNYPSLKDKNID